MPKIKGKIIRILDKRTVIINLGRRDGIQEDSIFTILGEPEAIVDPSTNEELGRVNIVKSRLQSAQVEEKYTIATTWIRKKSFELVNTLTSLYATGSDEGDLYVREKDIKPWKARSMEDPVTVGDTVEVVVPDKENQASDLKSDSSDQ